MPDISLILFYKVVNSFNVGSTFPNFSILPYEIGEIALFPFYCSYLTRAQRLNKISRCQGNLKKPGFQS